MKKIIAVLLKKALSFSCVVYMFTGCVLFEAVGTAVVGVAGAVAGGVGALADIEAARKEQMPLFGLIRMSKGVYTVNIDASKVIYSEEKRKNALNLLAQTLGYESYDFNMLSKYNNKKKNDNPYWEYSITMPGSISVVRNDLFTYRIDDDIEWTAVTDTKFGKNDYNWDMGIAYGNGMFVAVSANNKSGGIAFSSDGVNWTAVLNSTFGKSGVSAIAYGNSRFVAVDPDGKMAASSDGTTWTAVKKSPFGKDYVNDITYGNGTFVAIAGSRNKMAYSSDGINWAAVKNTTFGKGDYNWGITYGNGTFIVVAGEGGRMAYSSDGKNWTAVKKSPFGKNDYMDIGITYVGGKFIACSNSRTMYSSDGINWTTATSPIFWKDGTIKDIAYGDGKFVAVGEGGGDLMAYSSDGITWTGIAGSAFNGDVIKDIAYGNGKFVAVGNNGKMSYWDVK